MIEQLKPDYINRVPYAPEPLEMMEKINEIIDYLNKKEEDNGTG